VVAQNIQHGNLKFLVKYPLKPPILDMDVAGQHNNVGGDNWRHEIAELNM
jgi:ubiquitin-protein ligase